MQETIVTTFDYQRFTELKNRLLAQEMELKDERHQLWLDEKDSEQEYPVWERLESLSSSLLGYLSQIISNGTIHQPTSDVMKHLHELSIFKTDYVISWYINSEKMYPKIKQYLELLDYVRLLLLEYVEYTQPINESQVDFNPLSIL